MDKFLLPIIEEYENNLSAKDIISGYKNEFYCMTDEIDKFLSITEDVSSITDNAKKIILSIIESITKRLIALRDYMKRIWNKITGKIDYDELKKEISSLAKGNGTVKESAEDECFFRGGKIMFRAVAFNTNKLTTALNPESIINCIRKCRNDTSYALDMETYCSVLSDVLGEKIKSEDDVEDACKRAFLIDPGEETKKSFIEINQSFIDDARKFLSPNTGFQSIISKMTIIMNSFNIEFSNLFSKINKDKTYKVNNSSLKYLTMIQRGFLRIFEFWSSCMRSQSAVFLRGIYLVKDLIRRKKKEKANKNN
jgi:hypothetical protein